MKEVTDPALLAMLNGGNAQAPREVTDPALLAQLNAPPQQTPIADSALASVGLGSAFVAPQDPMQAAIAPHVQPQIETVNSVDPATGKIRDHVMPGSMGAAVALGERLQRDPMFREQVATAEQQRAAVNAQTWGGPQAGAITERPDRTLGELASDMAMVGKQGAREGVLGLAEAPVTGVNAINTSANYYMDNVAALFGADAPQIAMYDQPQALQDLRRETEAMHANEYERGASAAMGFDDANRPDDFLGALGYMLENPGVIATDAARTAGSMVSGIVPGSAQLTIAAQSLQQAGMSAHEVEKALFDKLVKQMPAEQAEQLAKQEAAKAFVNATAIGVAAPKLFSGGDAFERVLAGEAAERASSRVAGIVKPLAGETASEMAEEGAIQANQNRFSGDPIGKGVGAAAAQGGVLGMGMGSVPAGIELKDAFDNRPAAIERQVGNLLADLMTPEAIGATAESMRQDNPVELRTQPAPRANGYTTAPAPQSQPQTLLDVNTTAAAPRAQPAPTSAQTTINGQPGTGYATPTPAAPAGQPLVSPQGETAGAVATTPRNLFRQGLDSQEDIDVDGVSAEEVAELERELEADGWIADRIRKKGHKKGQHTNYFQQPSEDGSDRTSFHVGVNADGTWRVRTMAAKRDQPEVPGTEIPAATGAHIPHTGAPAEPITATTAATAIKQGAKNAGVDLRPARDRVVADVQAASAAARSLDEIPGAAARVSNNWRDRVVKLTGRELEAIGYKTFNVEGDGAFKVLNVKEALEDFATTLAKAPGFKLNPNQKHPVPGLPPLTATPAQRAKIMAEAETVEDDAPNVSKNTATVDTSDESVDEDGEQQTGYQRQVRAALTPGLTGKAHFADVFRAFGYTTEEAERHFGGTELQAQHNASLLVNGPGPGMGNVSVEKSPANPSPLWEAYNREVGKRFIAQPPPKPKGKRKGDPALATHERTDQDIPHGERGDTDVVGARISAKLDDLYGVGAFHLLFSPVKFTDTTWTVGGEGNTGYTLAFMGGVPKGVGGSTKRRALEANIVFATPFTSDITSPEFERAVFAAADNFIAGRGIALPVKSPWGNPFKDTAKRKKRSRDEDMDEEVDVDAMAWNGRPGDDAAFDDDLGAESEGAEAGDLSMDDLADFALESGVPFRELGRPANETDAEYIARLWRRIGEVRNGTDTGIADEAGEVDAQGAVQRGAGSGVQARRSEAGSARGITGGVPAAGWAGATHVAEGGKPRLVHRGSASGKVTRATFDRLGGRSDQPTSYLGVWFSSDETEASTFGPKVGSYYIDMRNPKVYDAAEFPDPDTPEEARALRQQLMAEGYDGMVMDLRGLGKERGADFHYVAFTAEQIIEPGAEAAEESHDTDAPVDGLGVEFMDDPEADTIDELRRARKRKAPKGPPITETRKGDVPMAYELDVFLDNGFVEDEINNMPPSQQVKVATRIVKQTFGFANVTVAHDLNAIEAYNQLAFGYRNLQSMAAVLGWPSQTFGKIVPNLVLGRTAHGSLAYYSPGEKLIALSRQNDAFAHEFAHGFDWWIWNKLGLVDAESGAPKGRATTGKLRLGASLKDGAIEEAFNELNDAMYKADGDAAFKIASLEKYILVIRNKIDALKAREAVAVDEARIAKIRDAIAKHEAHIQRLHAQIHQVTKRPQSSYHADSDYYLKARMLDKRYQSLEPDGTGYWQRPTEMFARAFEAWVAHTIETAGGSTEFLGRTDYGYLDTSVDFIEKAYPQLEDRDRIFAAIGALNEALRDTLTEGVKGDVPEVKPQLANPAMDWFGWQAPQRAKLRVWSSIKHTNQVTASQRHQNAEDAKLGKADRRRIRDMRKDGKWYHSELALRAHDLQVDVRAAWVQSISGHLSAMESRYPSSATYRKVSRIFTTRPGTGQLRGQVYEEYLQATRNRWGTQLGQIVDKHDLNNDNVWSAAERRQMRDAMVDHREDGERPNYTPKVLNAARDMRTYMDKLWKLLQDTGHDLGYVGNGYLPRIMNAELVNAQQAGFINLAMKVYAEVFEKEIGALETVEPGKLLQAALDAGLKKTDPDIRQLRTLMAKLATAQRNDDVDGAEEAADEIRALLEDGLYEKIQTRWANAASLDWMGRILGTTPGSEYAVHTSRGSFMKGRTLPPSADIILGGFMVNNAASLVATYMTSVINRVAFDKFIPPAEGSPDQTPQARLADIAAALRTEKVLSSDIEETMKSLELMTGLHRTNMTQRGLRRMSGTVAIYAPVVLGRSIMSQIVEPAAVMMRSGNVIDAAQMFRAQVGDLADWIPALSWMQNEAAKNRAAWRHEMASFIGAISSHHFDQVMNNRENTLYANRAAGQSNANFYLYSGIHPHAMSIRRATVERSIHYLKRIAAKAIKGDKRAVRDLADLGIDFGNQELVKYLAKDMPAMPTVAELEANKHAHAIMVAMNRFVDEVTMNPKMIDKPRAASTPERSFMYMVMSYSWAFTRNVLGRSVNRITTAWEKDGKGAGLSVAAYSAAMYSLYTAMTTMQYLLRVAIYSFGAGLDDELEKWKDDPQAAMLTILSRSGLTGAFDPALNAIVGVKYNRKFSELMTGAYLAVPLGAANKFARAEALETERTNTGDYNKIVAAYDGLIAPAIAWATLRYAPYAAAGLGWTSAPATKNAVAEALVGPKGSSTSGASGRAADRTGRRHTGRSGGRSGGAGASDRGTQR